MNAVLGSAALTRFRAQAARMLLDDIDIIQPSAPTAGEKLAGKREGATPVIVTVKCRVEVIATGSSGLPLEEGSFNVYLPYGTVVSAKHRLRYPATTGVIYLITFPEQIANGLPYQHVQATEMG